MSIAKGLSFYMNGVSLGLALQSFSADAEVEALDSTTIGKTSKTYATGLKNGTVSASGIWDYDQTNADKIHNVFSDAFTNATDSVCFGSLQALSVTNADLVMFNAVQSSYSIEIENGQLIICSADFQTTAGVRYGKLLYNAAVTAAASPVNSSSIDFGSGSTATGGFFQCQIYNPGGATGAGSTIVLQDSPDNSNWSTVSGSTLTATSAIYQGHSFEIPTSTTLQRYVRVRMTTAGGTVTYRAAYARN